MNTQSKKEEKHMRKTFLLAALPVAAASLTTGGLWLVVSPGGAAIK